MNETFEPKHAKLAAAYETPGALLTVCLDEPRKKLLGAGTDGSLHVVDLAAEKPVAEKKGTLHENYVAGLVLHQETTLISAGFDRKLVWTNLASGETIRSVAAHDGWVRKLALAADGARLVSVGDDMLAKVWDAKSGELLVTLAGHAKQTPQGFVSALYAVAVSPDGKHAATADRIGEIRVWDLATSKPVAELRSPEFYTFDPQKRARSIGGIRAAAFSPDGAKLAVSGIGQVTNVDGFVGPCRVEVWDWPAGKRLFAGQDKHQAVLNHVAFHPRSPWLVAAGGGDGGGALAFWDQSSATPQHLAKPKGHLHDFRFDLEGKRLYAAGHGGFQVWDVGRTG